MSKSLFKTRLGGFGKLVSGNLGLVLSNSTEFVGILVHSEPKRAQDLFDHALPFCWES